MVLEQIGHSHAKLLYWMNILKYIQYHEYFIYIYIHTHTHTHIYSGCIQRYNHFGRWFLTKLNLLNNMISKSTDEMQTIIHRMDKQQGPTGNYIQYPEINRNRNKYEKNI